MKKFAVALASALALSALSAGAANADCPAVGSSGAQNEGVGEQLLPGFWVGTAGDVTVYGEDPLGVGYGESTIGFTGTDVTYDGELAANSGAAHGEIEGGSVGLSGVHGSADGQVAGVLSGSGHADVPGGHVSAGSNLVPCTTVP